MKPALQARKVDRVPLHRAPGACVPVPRDRGSCKAPSGAPGLLGDCPQPGGPPIWHRSVGGLQSCPHSVPPPQPGCHQRSFLAFPRGSEARSPRLPRNPPAGSVLGVVCTRQRAPHLNPLFWGVGLAGVRRRWLAPPLNQDRLPGGGGGGGAQNGGKAVARQMGSGRLFPAYGAAWAEGVWAGWGEGAQGCGDGPWSRDTRWGCERDGGGGVNPSNVGAGEWGRPWTRSPRSLRKAMTPRVLHKGAP